MNLESLIGQTLDSKYFIEKELGRGGMGAVYLATHVGTERAVALKVIVPQFMERAEFVERFRREARAAGRLRHPNVVNVTDFGFADTIQGRVAYLVMEYLDGCTLGEILDEERQLPLAWTLDILEQVCSAVHEAHGQGIIHRDLKPDNIWLEPNQRGGYTVKVLDFGIAKLEEQMSENGRALQLNPSTAKPTQTFQQNITLADQTRAETVVENRGATLIAESGTLIQAVELEGGTAIFPAAEVSLEDGTAIFPDKGTQIIEKDEKGTRLIATVDQTERSPERSSGSDLTRVGAVLGTPLYMSPEQCRGEKLTPRSDIYSLAVIAYQMLSGKTPFEGDFTQVMESHKDMPPPPLEAKRVPRKVKKVLLSALAKDTAERPQTAEAFASKLRAHSEGIGRLLQRALVIYSEHLPKFLLLALLTMFPVLLLTIVRVVLNFIRAAGGSGEDSWTDLISILLTVIVFFIQIIAAALLVGTTTWITAQVLAVPLREVSLKAAFREVKKRWKPLAKTVTASTLLSMVGLFLCFFPGVYLSARFMLIAPSIMMEDLSGRAAFRRSGELTKRSFRTVFATALLVYFVPVVLAGIISFLIGSTIRSFDPARNNRPAVVKTENKTENKDDGFNINYRGGSGVEITATDETEENKKEQKNWKMRPALAEGIFEIFWTPFAILIASFTSVITALIYFKTRQAGGESMQDLLAKFEDAEHPQSKWQHRIRERLIQSGRISSTEKR